MIPAPEPLVTADEIKRRFFAEDESITRGWVLRHCPKIKLSRAVVRFRPSAVAAWIAERERAA